MPLAAVGWAFQQELLYPEKWTLFLLADAADEEGFGEIEVVKFCKEAGMNEAQARSFIGKLAKKRLIRVSTGASLKDESKIFYCLKWEV
jgi:hypothetical protein